MFMSATSYAHLCKILKNEGIRDTSAAIKRVDDVIRTALFIELFGPSHACRGPNGERLRFIPVKGGAE